MKDLTGQTLNNRLITGQSDEKSGGHWLWNYQCNDCGKTGTVRESDAIKNSCQCIMSKHRPQRVKNMSGKIYGKWTVTDKYEIRNDTHTYWLCNCECGNQRWVSRPNLVNNASTNCGCSNKKNKI
jgi:hypothetical protein